MVRIGKFWRLSDREFPEFFKTHPTLICRSIVRASRRLQTKPATLSGRTLYSFPKNVLERLVSDLVHYQSGKIRRRRNPFDINKLILGQEPNGGHPYGYKDLSMIFYWELKHA